MIRQLTSSFFALLATLLAFGMTASPAAAAGIHYRAHPAAVPAEARLVVRDIVWRCGAGGCTAPENGSRPAIVCSALARELGALRSFTVAGRSFGAEELENCNRRAR